jgi:outer membrane protein insertion porin family
MKVQHDNRFSLMRSIVFIFSILFVGLSAIGQDVVDYSKPRNYEIADIKVSGVKYLHPDLLINISGLKVGNTIAIPGDDITKVIEKFWSQKLFSDVQVFITKTEGNKAWLEIQLKERDRISSYTLNGVRKAEKQDLDDKLQIRRGSQITPNVLNNIDHILSKHYIEKGFLNVDVQFTQREDTLQENRVILDINVEKNKKVKIKEIEINGNTAFTDKRLRRVLKNTKQKDINIFKGSKLKKEEFKEDKGSLRTFYNKNGYRDFKLLSEQIVSVDDNNIKLILNIEEGNQYYFGDIQWVGNTKYPDRVLNKVLGISSGDVYNQALLDERLSTDDDAVTSLYMDDGYLFFSANPVEVNIESDTINFEMQIYEGQQARINSIIIKGNTKTNEHVVRRELRTVPGDLFSKTLLIRSVRELAALGHFNPENIVPNPIPNQSDGTVDIEYNLEERSNDQLEVSAGYGALGPVGTIGLRFSNFAIGSLFDKEAWQPLPTGDGQTLSLRAQLSGRGSQSYNISFVEPWFGGKKPNSFSFSVFYNIYDQAAQIERYRRTNPTLYNYYQGLTTSGSKFNSIGFSLGLGRRLKFPDDFFTLFNEVSYQRYDLKDYYSIINNGIINNLSFNTTLSRNSQDQMIYPRSGSSFSLALMLTPPFSMFKEDKFWKLDQNAIDNIEDELRAEYDKANGIGQWDSYQNRQAQIDASVLEDEKELRYKWLEYHKWTFKSAWYKSIVGNLVLSTRAEYGHLGMYNRSLGHSPFEKFALGGDGLSGYSITGTDIVALRGYDDRILTPRNADGSENGNIYVKYTMELRYPVTLNPSATVFGLVFLEAGNAWANFRDVDPFKVKRSVGVGVRAFLPMFGLLGIDYGRAIDDVFDANGNPVRTEKNQFHFMIGQQF